MKKTLLALPAILLLSSLLLCSRYETNNPLSSNYIGNYSFAVTTALLPDTMEVFNRYTMPFAHGVDTFVSYGVNPSAESSIDTLQFSQLIKKDTLKLYFVKQYIGDLTVRAIRPNLKENTVAVPIVVVNPYRISGVKQVVVGTNTTLLIVHFRNKPFSGTIKKVKWNVNGIFSPEGAIATPIIIRGDSVSTKKVFALIYDTLGNFISTDTATVQVSPRIPVVSFLQDSMDVPVGQESVISITSTDCDSIRWIVKRLGIQTTTVGPLKVTFTSATKDTIIATGVNRFGAISKPDTLYVRAAVFNYALQRTAGQFPDTIRARQWATWRVSVVKNGSIISGSNITYEWKTIPDSIADTLRTNSEGNQLQLFIRDSISPFMISVRAKIGTDSTYRQQQPVVTREFLPSCSFVTTDYQSQINQNVTLTVKADDSNTDGGIAGIYYTTSDNTIPVYTNGQKTWSVQFSTPGQKLIRAVSVDNEGFISDTAIARATITASKPYFVRPAIDTGVFINDSISVIAKAAAGNPGDSIVSYQWDLNNDGIWDKTTVKNRFDTLFRQAGTYRFKVGCRDNRGDSTETLAVVVIHVGSGTPVVKSISCNPTTSYIGSFVNLRITASDTNGSVKKFAVKINGGPDSLFTVRSAPLVDTTFSFLFATPGKYLFSVAAIDDDNQKSAYLNAADSLVVTKGNPVSKGIRPDTVYIMDDTTFRVSAVGVKNTVKTFFVKWEPLGTFEQFADSLVKHKYTTAGKRLIYEYVVDSAGLVSDTITDSVVVLLGKPASTFVIADSVWYRDTTMYKIRGADVNGTISQWAISWDNGQPFEARSDSMFSHAYASAGIHTLRGYVVDNDGISSDTVSTTVYVKLGKPSAVAVFSDSVWINRNNSFKVSGTDPNGTVQQWAVSWDSGLAFEIKSDSNFTYTYTSMGLKHVRVFTIDNSGLSSDTGAKDVFVKLGKPVITSITPDSTIFINDARQFAIATFDTNGTVDSLRIDNGTGSFSGFVKISNGAYTFNRTFARSEAGNRIIRIIAKDNDGLLSDTAKLTVAVRWGTPVADSLHLPSIVWINDTNSYQTFARDTNGTISKYFFDWTNSGTTWSDSSTNGSASTQFASAGLKTIRYGFRDNDTLMATATQQVFVHLGMPRVSAASDTLFVPSTDGKVGIKLMSYDTNGTIAYYKWDRGADGSIEATTTIDSLFYDQINLNVAVKWAVQIKDGDSLTAADTFWVYPDAPPPVTITTAPQFDSVVSAGTNVNLRWKKDDVRDKLATQFEIVFWGGSPVDTSRIAWTPGTTYFTNNDGTDNHYAYTFTPSYPASRTVYWRVDAKDARGSLTKGGQSQFFYLKP